MPDTEILDFRERIDALLVGLQNKDPRMHELLRLMAQSQTSVVNTLQPIQKALRDIQAEPPIPLGAFNWNYELHLRFVRMTWDYTDPNIMQVEIREGTVWDTAAFVVRSSTKRVEIDPILVGHHDYMLKTMNSSGVYSELAMTLGVDIPAIGLPANLTAQVIDNNVLLRWEEPTTTFEISHYEIYRAVGPFPPVNFALYSLSDTTFVVIFEMSGGDYGYGIIAVDIASNTSPMAQVILQVNQPPDFILLSDFLSTWTGTKINCILEEGRLLAIIDTDDTWTTHFTEDSWDQPSDQVGAGFPIFIEPSAASGSYQEVHDFGLLLSSVIVHAAWSEEAISGTVTTTSTIESSEDGVIWTDPVQGRDAFFDKVRYVRFTMNFTSTDPKDDLTWFSSLHLSLDVKSVIDSGEVMAVATDGNGTFVAFNKPFKDVDSITTGIKSVPPLEVVVDFQDVPNPVGFRVLVFDTAGHRVSQLVSWKARGVV